MPNAVWPATYAEYFPTRVRLSGMAIGTQFGFALAGFTPTIAGALMGGDADNWYKVARFAVRRLRHLRDRRADRPVEDAPGARRPRSAAGRAGPPTGRRPWVSREHHADADVVPARAGRRRHRRLAHPGDAGARGPRAAAWRVSYRIIDAEALGLGVDDLPELLAWAERLGYDGLNVTHPFKQAVVPLLDELSEDAADLGAVNTVVFRDGRRLGRNTDWSGYGRAFREVAARRRRRPGGPRRRGRRRRRRRLRAARPGRRARRRRSTPTAERADACVVRLAKRFGDDRVTVATDLERALGRGAAASSTRRPVGHERARRVRRSRPSCCAPDLWVSDVVYFPLETELVAPGPRARLPGAARRRDGRAARRSTRSSTSPVAPADADRMARHFAELTA